MRPLSLITEDAVAIRGIVDLLEAGPATTREISATQHTGTITAGRLCRALQTAGIIAHQIVVRDVLGAQQQVPLLEWCLTESYRLGKIEFNAETLAGGV